jgi:hypothetical protein
MRRHVYPRFYPVLLCLLAAVAGYLLTARPATAGVSVVKTITGEEAIQHVQQTNTVCGTIASTRYAQNAPGKPTYLNFDRPFPAQTCVAVIDGSIRAKFKEAPESAFKGKRVCITGLITTNSFKKAQITIDDPSQIVVAEPPPATNQTNAATGQ